MNNLLKPSTLEESFFAEDSGAYPFTNESLSDILNTKLNLEGNALIITSSGDIQILFGGLGIRVIDSLDISRKSNAWADYKWNYFQTATETEYKNSLIINSFWKNFPRDLKVKNESNEIFFGKERKDDANIYDSDIFKKVSFQGLKINSLGYLGRNYKLFQKNTVKTSLNFHLGKLEKLSELENLNKKFSLVYLSNVLDHALVKTGKRYDFSRQNIIRILEHLVNRLAGDAQVIFNFAWNGRSIPGAKKALGYFGYNLREIEKNSEGCGQMYLSERI